MYAAKQGYKDMYSAKQGYKDMYPAKQGYKDTYWQSDIKMRTGVYLRDVPFMPVHSRMIHNEHKSN